MIPWIGIPGRSPISGFLREVYRYIRILKNDYIVSIQCDVIELYLK